MKQVKNTEPKPKYPTYKRAAWKNITGWLAFSMIIVLDIALLGSSLHLNGNFDLLRSLKGIVAYLIVLLLQALVIPSIVFEIDSIVIEPEAIIFKNLLFRVRENWDDLSSVFAPIYLKFAILRGKKFIYLINKRDLGNYDELMKLIRQKAKNLK